ncbi:Acid-resistance membrane protein OS=Tsukamurella paurometabola (strain ATCC 8368 / DSM / CCUG 35730 / CIP 100753 / JCM 10117 / KCTC 9821 / NBRC 16120 /NCIMB 702349 / NCTC 13040) OX=521096 GN=Tpau_0343 PE=4 SV=1 [Tsukamurella paurometabola]|uniref:Acid-resistance membrane protein n=1 Tax=Tsukamurella paurometabola (strain ATCC 8368 / DSM 20162 / CCUG 35730 / CIP 100753 / JCM 10117 / KCTC 9821 / NBRC 16120 / NCIMB 702349 / NCTC 13040) TaxID=521096 RepID=D5URD3_TSUPD|nr:DUF308 domain-containing protein [Tsukamurella paurometabola]ADG76986.1 conserved hypothetical protein [Tsukamurella paurometabola DSM 20162]SUP42375.1 Uncharacterized conserved protein [Tsukamurella paurometabola]
MTTDTTSSASAPQEQPPRHSLVDEVRGYASDVVTKVWQSVLGIGIVAIVLGAVILAWPSPTLRVVGVLFAIYLLLIGILQLYTVFGPIKSESNWWRFLTFISGALSIVLSVLAFRSEGDSLVMLAIWIGVGWLIQGIVGFAVGLDLPNGTPHRILSIFASILFTIAGVIVVIYPYDAIAPLTYGTGIALIIIGLVQVVHAFQIRSSANKAIPQV